jgi:MarR family transcriptional regulator, temperature-dependent positive regulator of motility
LKEMLNRMVARGWVARKRDARDSRAWTMSLTDEGRALLLDRIDKVEAAQHEILEPLSEADRETFMRCMRVLLRI